MSNTMTNNNEPVLKLSHALRNDLALSPSLATNERVNQMWAENKTVYHLGFGESRFPVHPKLQAALATHSHQKSYLSAQGLPQLRRAIASFYTRRLDLAIDAEQVIVGTGSKSLLFALQLALDADLILPTPSWVSYAPQAELLNKPTYWIPASADDDYRLTIGALDQTVQRSQNSRQMLLINSPNCPTGQMLTPEFLQELADYCRRNNIIVLSDEIYSLIPHNDQPHHSIASYYPEGTIVLGGVSKHLSLGGWRLGMAIVPATNEGQMLMSALCRVAGEVWSSPTAPVQYALVTAYDDPDIDAYIEECAQIHAIRTHYLWEGIQELNIRCARPDGGFYLFPNFNDWRAPLNRLGIYTSVDLAEHLLEEYQLATLAGTALGTPPEDLSLRLATSYVDMETAENAQVVLAAYRQNPDPDALIRSYHPHTQEVLQRFQAFKQSLMVEQPVAYA
ncbi:MAG: aminotransferase class I/II-fold pyridoxal phosphate-dependent enzyme [Chloroflexota bacterium]